MIDSLNIVHQLGEIPETDALVVGLLTVDDEVTVAPCDLSAERRESLSRGFRLLQASAKAEKITTLIDPENPERLIIGVGLGDDVSYNVLRECAGAVSRSLRKIDSVSFVLPVDDVAALEAIATGVCLGSYSFDRYQKEEAQLVTRATILSPLDEDDIDGSIIERSKVVAESVHLVRDLVNIGPAEIYPETMVDHCVELAEKHGLGLKVWDMTALEADGCGGIIGVGRGSDRGPRLVRLEWNPENAVGFTALVGKGITFDSGGYSLKPPKSMVTMKSDMAGAATVLATICAAAALEIPTRVVAWLPLAENMVSGHATHPGDVLRMANGLTVEVNNTDAEGRLVLGDALALAVKEEPDDVIDVATLTGAQISALGTRCSGVMGNGLEEVIAELGDFEGEEMWAMPLPEYLFESLHSEIATMTNSGGAMGGGMLTAGLFLKRFVGDTSWAHIDIAGPSFNEGSPWGYTPKGATGVAVRTLLCFLETQSMRDVAAECGCCCGDEGDDEE